MKIIDLLNKIANGEEVPKKIKYDNAIAEYDEEGKDYYSEGYSGLFSYTIPEFINDEIEIIEDKKIKKISHFDINASKSIKELEDSVNLLNRGITTKINEIIDYINKENK